MRTKTLVICWTRLASSRYFVGELLMWWWLPFMPLMPSTDTWDREENGERSNAEVRSRAKARRKAKPRRRAATAKRKAASKLAGGKAATRTRKARVKGRR